MDRKPDLKKIVREGLRSLKGDPSIVAGEIFVSRNLAHTARLHYTSHLPCNGVEEPKTFEFSGVSVRLVLKDGDSVKIGFGSEASEMSVDGIGRAREKAKRNAVVDPHFPGFPPFPGRRPRRGRTHDPALSNLSDRRLVELGWTIIRGGLKGFGSSESLAAYRCREKNMEDPGLILSGDVSVVMEEMAVGTTSSDRMTEDRSTLLMAYVTAMVEADEAKGTCTFASGRMDGFSGEIGRSAAENAARCIGGMRTSTRVTSAILGPQAVADILNNLLVPSVTTGAFFSSSSPFLGKFNQMIASDRLSVVDDGTAKGLMGTKTYTCEGLPTARTPLIEKGRLVGLLSSHYDAQRLLNDPGCAAKLGVSVEQAREAIQAHNGFRYGATPGRHFASPPHTAATNIIVEPGRASLQDMMKQMGEGLLIGRIWYTYPINGLQKGDFTSTIVGDSFLVRRGEIESPLRANCVRLNDNLMSVLSGIRAVGNGPEGVVIWASDEVIYTPPLRIENLRIEEIGANKP